MVVENGVKNIQAAAYNGACTVCGFMSNLIIKSWKDSMQAVDV